MPKNIKFSEDTSSSDYESDSSNNEWEQDDIYDKENEFSDNEDNDDNEDNNDKEIIDSSSDESENSDSETDDEEIETETETKKDKSYNNCIYDYTNENNDTLDELPENEKTNKEIINNFQNAILENEKKIRKDTERITRPFLLDKERIRLLSLRTDQLAKGAKSFIKGASELPPDDVAKLELEYKKIPLIIERELPDKTYERWHITEFLNI